MKMKHIGILSIAFMTTWVAAAAQETNVPPIAELPHMAALMNQVEQNNLTLKAARAETEAIKSANRQESSLPDPEVEFGLLWDDEGTRRFDFSASQSLDASVISGRQRALRRSKDCEADGQYGVLRKEVMLQVCTAYINLVSLNALEVNMQQNQQEMQSVLKAQQELLSEGRGNIIALNEAQSVLADIAAELANLQSEQADLQSELTQLNGGEAVVVSDTSLPNLLPSALPTMTYDQWVAENGTSGSEQTLAMSQTQVARGNVAVARSQAWPQLSVGFMSEKEPDLHYKGVTWGMSIPLWQATRGVKQSKSELTAAEAKQAQALSDIQARQRQLFDRARRLCIRANALDQTVKETDSRALLLKSLEAGRIGVAEFAQGAMTYYEIRSHAIEAVRDSQLAWVELMSTIM